MLNSSFIFIHYMTKPIITNTNCNIFILIYIKVYSPYLLYCITNILLELSHILLLLYSLTQYFVINHIFLILNYLLNHFKIRTYLLNQIRISTS